MVRYALNLGDDGRILSATEEQYGAPGQPIVTALPMGDISNFLFVDGGYVYSPPPIIPEPVRPTDMDRIEAQTMYTALMTDSLLED